MIRAGWVLWQSPMGKAHADYGLLVLDQLLLVLMLVELLRVTETMVMPLPENAIVAPLTKSVPVTVMFCAPVPRPFEFGLIEMNSGVN